MKRLLFILAFLPMPAYAGKEKTSYTTKKGQVISIADSVKILRGPYIFTYPRRNVDGKLQLDYKHYMERFMYNKTYKIDRFTSTTIGGRLIQVICIVDPKASHVNARPEFFIETDKAIEAGEVEIVKAK